MDVQFILNIINEYDKEFQTAFKQSMSEYNLGRLGAIQTLVDRIRKTEQRTIFIIKDSKGNYLRHPNKRIRKYISNKNAVIALRNYCNYYRLDFNMYKIESENEVLSW